MPEKSIRKIGVMGGSFDPIHTGHLIIAEHILDMLNLDIILFVPCNVPSHKDSAGLTPANHRLRMIELALQGNPRFQASDIELKRGGVSYSVDTVSQLISLYGEETKIYFLIGADSLKELSTWKDYKKLLSLCTVVTAGRPDTDIDNWVASEETFSPEEIAVLKKHIAPTPLIDISSTEIRRRRREGESIRNMVPEVVERYIIKNNLYGKAC